MVLSLQLVFALLLLLLFWFWLLLLLAVLVDGAILLWVVLIVVMVVVAVVWWWSLRHCSITMWLSPLSFPPTSTPQHDRPATLSRRRAIPETLFRQEVASLNSKGMLRAVMTSVEAAKAATDRAIADHLDLATRGRPGGPVSEAELGGRQSGSVEWRQARAEI